MSLLTVESLYAGYTDQDILHGVSLRVEPGEVVTIIGPNGAGKSTLLRAVVGLLRVRRGKVLLRGEEVTGRGPEFLLGRKVAFVPQTGNVFPSLTVSENFEVSFHGTRAAYRAAVDSILALFPALQRRWKFRAGQLSGGERQLLAIGRSLLTGADLLLLDEPTAALAPSMVETIFQKVQEINRRGTSILMVEQNARRALKVSHRAYVLETGNNALDGTGEELLHDPRVGQLYLGGTDTVHLLRRAAEEVLGRLRSDIPGLEAHLGEEYERSDRPEAAELRRNGGHFRWLAFAIAPAPMWALHVGILVEDDGQLSLGLHAHERFAPEPPAVLAALGAKLGATYRYSAGALEHQFNRPPLEVTDANLEAFVAQVVECCRALAGSEVVAAAAAQFGSGAGGLPGNGGAA